MVSATTAVAAEPATYKTLQALKVPPVIRSFLIGKGREDLITRFEAIPVVSPAEFAKRFVGNGAVQPLGAGYNGIAFGNSSGRVAKFNFNVFAAFDKVKLNPFLRWMNDAELRHAQGEWKSLFETPAIADVDISALRKLGGEVGCQPISEELLGTLIWAAYNPKLTEFPSMVSSDMLAFEVPFVSGVTLKDILESEREGTALHRSYDMKKLWKQVAFWQHVSELMIRDAGVTVDMFTPGNMLVQGDPLEPVIQMIDNALATPSPEAREYYQAKGWKIPPQNFSEALRVIVWPTMPEHIVSSRLWDLTFTQSVQYVKAFFELADSTDAVRKLASLGEWKIVEAPVLQNYVNVRKARLLAGARDGFRADSRKLLRRCEALLKKSG